MREVYLSIQTPGVRPTNVVVVTTLMGSQAVSQVKLAYLYRLRWQATEVNFRHLKTP